MPNSLTSVSRECLGVTNEMQLNKQNGGRQMPKSTLCQTEHLWKCCRFHGNFSRECGTLRTVLEYPTKGVQIFNI